VKHLLLSLLVLLGLHTIAPAGRADVVTFDDLPGNYFGIPAGYAGYNWNNFGSVNSVTTAYQQSGFATGMVSPTNVAYNIAGATATITSATPGGVFSLTSGFFTGVWENGLTITAVGSKNGMAVGSPVVFEVNTIGPTFETFNFQNVDTVTFTVSPGTVNPNSGGIGTEFAVDNVSLSAANAPEPTSLTLLGLGAVCTGVCSWRRRRR
jgi:hypothetical protein